MISKGTCATIFIFFILDWIQIRAMIDFFALKWSFTNWKADHLGEIAYGIRNNISLRQPTMCYCSQEDLLDKFMLSIVGQESHKGMLIESLGQSHHHKYVKLASVA